MTQDKTRGIKDSWIYYTESSDKVAESIDAWQIIQVGTRQSLELSGRKEVAGNTVNREGSTPSFALSWEQAALNRSKIYD